MKVRELIEQLAAFDPEFIVLRSDNSGGYEGITKVWTEAAIETATKKQTKVAVVGE